MGAKDAVEAGHDELALLVALLLLEAEPHRGRALHGGPVLVVPRAVTSGAVLLIIVKGRHRSPAERHAPGG